MTTLYSPTRALVIVARNTWRRLRCHHQPADADGFGYTRCGVCGTWVLA